MATILIGRSEKSYYRVSDPTVSRIHAQLDYRSRDDVTIFDLGSKNGTYVLGREGWTEISGETSIKRTDQLRFGQAKVFVADIIADAKLPDITEPAGTPDQGSGPVEGEIVPPKRELSRPRRNIFTGEVEES